MAGRVWRRPGGSDGGSHRRTPRRSPRHAIAVQEGGGRGRHARSYHAERVGHDPEDQPELHPYRGQTRWVTGMQSCQGIPHLGSSATNRIVISWDEPGAGRRTAGRRPATLDVHRDEPPCLQSRAVDRRLGRLGGADRPGHLRLRRGRTPRSAARAPHRAPGRGEPAVHTQRRASARAAVHRGADAVHGRRPYASRPPRRVERRLRGRAGGAGRDRRDDPDRGAPRARSPRSTSAGPPSVRSRSPRPLSPAWRAWPPWARPSTRPSAT